MSEFIRVVHKDAEVEQRLYKLSGTYVHPSRCDDPIKPTGFSYVVASYSRKPYLLESQGCGETYLFPAIASGETTDLLELPGSRKGDPGAWDEVVAAFESECSPLASAEGGEL